MKGNQKSIASEQWMHLEYKLHNGRDFIRTTMWKTTEGGVTKWTLWVPKRISRDDSVAARRMVSVRETVADDIID